MIQRKIGGNWSIVLNCENVFDARQSRYESLYTGSVSDPVFKPLWAPIDGRVLNLFLRYRR
jgi:iron complex outermembrane receptor protein/outer membrane receptor for ferrienterochelin and colicins